MSVENLNSSGSEAAVATPEPRRESDNHLLWHLLKIADGYRADGSIRQAREIYFMLAEEHGDSPEAEQARGRLMEIAEAFEQAGELRQARGIYERLL